MKEQKDACKLCGEKLDKKEGDALYYCLKCSEETGGYKNGKSKGMF